MPDPIKRLALMTSGGDAPGMNAAIRAVVRTALFNGLEIYGVRQAFRGLVNGDLYRMDTHDVGGIIQRGGTILQTARFPEFETAANQRKALRVLSEKDIPALIVIGGDGSMRGALATQGQGIHVVGIPGSIDNDIWATDSCIGVDTALNTILSAVDKLRDTASSHQRVFIVEVMGRHCGYLAMVTGLVTGAEVVLIPEHENSLDELGKQIEEAYLEGKSHGMIVVAEGANLKTAQIAEHLRQHDIGFEVRETILGHVQRGGAPTAFDRLLATRLGVAAVTALIEGKSGVMVALRGRSIDTHPLDDIVGKLRPINPQFAQMAEILAR